MYNYLKKTLSKHYYEELEGAIMNEETLNEAQKSTILHILDETVAKGKPKARWEKTYFSEKESERFEYLLQRASFLAQTLDSEVSNAGEELFRASALKHHHVWRRFFGSEGATILTSALENNGYSIEALGDIPLYSKAYDVNGFDEHVATHSGVYTDKKTGKSFTVEQTWLSIDGGSAPILTDFIIMDDKKEVIFDMNSKEMRNRTLDNKLGMLYVDGKLTKHKILSALHVTRGYDDNGEADALEVISYGKGRRIYNPTNYKFLTGLVTPEGKRINRGVDAYNYLMKSTVNEFYENGGYLVYGDRQYFRGKQK